MLDEYDKQAINGSLLANYDESSYRPDSVHPLPLLTGTKRLRSRAITFLNRNRRERQRTVPIDSGPGNNPDGLRIKAPTSIPDHPAFVDKLAEVDEELHRLVLSPVSSQGITQPLEMAGLQLYPRIDWASSAMKELHKHLARILSSVSNPGSAGIDLLNALHKAASEEFEQKINEAIAHAVSQEETKPGRETR